MNRPIIIYIVGKYPRKGDPKQGKYPAIFEGMRNRGYKVLMIVHNSKFNGLRNPFAPIKTDFKDGSVLIESCLLTFFNKNRVLLGIKRNNFIKNYLERHVLSTLSKEVLHLVGELSFSGPIIIHTYESASRIGEKLSLKLKDSFSASLLYNVHASLVYERGLSHDKEFFINFLRNVFFFLPVSKPLGEKWTEVFGKDLISSPITVPNPVNSKLFKLKSGISGKKPFVFIHISKMDTNRNIEEIIGGFRKFSDHYGKTELWLIGKNRKDLISEGILGKQYLKKVKVLGTLDRIAVAHRMRESNVLIQASDFETFGNPIVEALMCGLPVIVSKSGGPESYISSDLGVVLKDNTVENIYSAMVEIFKRYDEFNPKEIRSYAISRFDEDAVLNKLEYIYQNTVC